MNWIYRIAIGWLLLWLAIAVFAAGFYGFLLLCADGFAKGMAG